MTFLEQLQSLDRRDVGRWPMMFRLGLIAIIFVAVAIGASYYFVWQNKRPELLRVQEEELQLRQTFEQKQKKAANLEAYKEQLREMERSFGAMLRQLPGKTEVPSLLVDISQAGLAAGLEEKLFQPSNEVRREFYAELPIKIRLTGSYHELGNFVSGIAALPRIVTLHNIEIKPLGKETAGSDDLQLDVTAKTYRYLEDEEDKGDAAAGPAGTKKPTRRIPPAGQAT
ncbi:MAG TPA: type 4a pilus biogenesis protein PilO [Steroidobacteraceae bacterium]|nr:type 4a pilus biogenesis protein PilO [Steroidobacteraceae bacterium]